MDVSVGLLVIDPPGVRLGVLSAQQVHALLSGIPACAKYGLAAPGALADGAMHTDKLCCMVLLHNLACTACDCMMRCESLQPMEGCD